MADEHWTDISGTELRYSDATWQLTGDVAVRKNGELLSVEAKRVDDVRHGRATLQFELQNPPHSLNPGHLGEHFDRLEREGEDYVLVVKTDHRSYRYELLRIEYE